MLDTFYYFTTKNIMLAFETLFNNISVRRYDASDNVIQTIKVPIAQAVREKFLAREEQNPTLNEEKQIVLPRLSYEMVSIEYDATRALNRMNRFTRVTEDGHIMEYIYQSVPYILTFSLSSIARITDDSFQIMEQILPYFTPDFTIRINALPEFDLQKSLPIVLNSVTPTFEYDGAFDDSRKHSMVEYSFSIRADYYGPIHSQGVIKKTIVQLYSNVEATNDNVASNVLSNAVSRITTSVNPLTANVDETYTIDTVIIDNNENS